MKRKLRRSILSIAAIFIILFTFIFSSFSVSASTYSLGTSGYYEPFTSIDFLGEAIGAGNVSYTLTYPFSVADGINVTQQSTVASGIQSISVESANPSVSSTDTVDDFSVSYLNIPFLLMNSSNVNYDATFKANDFYVVLENSDERDPNNLGFALLFDNLSSLDFVCVLNYSVAGSDEILTFSWQASDRIVPGVHPNLVPRIGTGVFYIHSFECYIPLALDDLDSLSGSIAISSIDHYNLLEPRMRDLGAVDAPDPGPGPEPEPPPNPGYQEISPELFENYTGWISTALSGFLDFQFIPGFSMGGLLLILITFAFVIYFLKMFAGG